jgi:GTP-binding protein HflX
VASFKSTLEEITEADILLHIVDISSPFYEDQINVVQETLEDLGAGDTSTLVVFNKIDLLQDRSIISTLTEKHPNRVFISATRGINIVGLKDEVAKLLEKEFTIEEIVLPNSRQKLIAQLYDIGEVLERTYENEHVRMKIRIHRRDRERFLQLVK